MLRRIIDSVILVAAIWLIISPYVFGYYAISAPSGIASFLGLAVLILATTELTLPDYWEEIALVFTGILVTASPWLFGDVYYISHTATESMIVTGAVISTFAVLGLLVSMLQEREHEKLQHH
jgi:hypothetical protein